MGKMLQAVGELSGGDWMYPDWGVACAQDEDVFNPRKDVVRNMTVLLRTEDSKSSEWRKPWSIAKVNRSFSAPPHFMGLLL